MSKGRAGGPRGRRRPATVALLVVRGSCERAVEAWQRMSRDRPGIAGGAYASLRWIRSSPFPTIPLIISHGGHRSSPRRTYSELYVYLSEQASASGGSGGVDFGAYPRAHGELRGASEASCRAGAPLRAHQESRVMTGLPDPPGVARILNKPLDPASIPFPAGW